MRGRGALRLLRSSRFALTQPDRAPSCDFRYAKAPHYVRRGTWPLRGRCISRQAHLHARVFCVDLIKRSTRASSPVRQRKVVSNKLFPFNRRLVGELYRCGLCPSAPLPLCVKNISSQSRDSFPNLVNPVNPVKKVRLSASVLREKSEKSPNLQNSQQRK